MQKQISDRYLLRREKMQLENTPLQFSTMPQSHSI